MLSVAIYAFNAVAPIITLILLGTLARKTGMVSENAFKEINRMNFRFAFSCMCFNNLYKTESFDGFEPAFFVLVMATLLIMTGVGLALTTRVTKVRNRKGVLAQVFFRSNYAVIGLPVAAALAGNEALALASAYQVPTVIYFNFAAVLLLSVYSDNGSGVHFRKVAMSIATNPLVIGLVSGAIVLFIRPHIPVGADGELVFSLKKNLPFVYQIISYLGSMATPLALICLGGRLSAGEFGKYKKELIFANVMRLILVPLGAFTIALLASSAGLVELTPARTAVLVAVFASPIAVSTVAMAQEMGGDDALAGQIVVTTSIFGMVSLFFWIFAVRLMGFL
ncbi:MAG: AEC family transporter [Lachnospiraceae bacterium]|nr:AEC family transporter [Lachnospiraceae bacterium]